MMASALRQSHGASPATGNSSEHPAARLDAPLYGDRVKRDEMAEADCQGCDLAAWPNVCLGWRPVSWLLWTPGPAPHRAEKLDLEVSFSVTANPSPLDLSSVLPVDLQAQ